LRQLYKYEALKTFLAWVNEGLASSLPRRIIFPSTAYRQCAHYSGVGYGAGGADISSNINALAGI